MDRGPVAIERLKKRQKLEERRKTAYRKVKRALAAYAKLVETGRPLIRAEMAITELAQQELVRRLQEDPEALPPTVLNRLKDSGINTVARSEQWDKPRGHDPRDALAAIADRMSKIKGKLKIEVSHEPEKIEEAEVIDVTPEPRLIDR